MQTKRLLCAALSFLVLVCGNALAQEKITLKLDGVTLREAFGQDIREWEWQWTFGREEYAVEPSGDEIEICKEIYKEYADRII